MNNDTKKPNILWRSFRSVRLTIVLLILIAIASVLGTFIPQREEALEFAHRLDPDTFRLFYALGLFDMYHSAWFRILVGLLALNLVICSIDRFPGAWRRFSARPRPDRSKVFHDIPEDQRLEVITSGESVLETVRTIIASKYKRVTKKTSPPATFFYAEKGRFSHFGVYIVHLSVLIIIAGALIGSFYGFEAYVNILEGEKVDSAMIRGRMLPVDLGFSVRCDDFSVSFYDNGTPKEYRSDLTFFENGKKVKSAVVRVNYPAKFRGIIFYQSSYGTIPGDSAMIRLVRRASKPEVRSVNAGSNKEIPLPHGEGTFVVLKIKDNFMNMGPAVLIKVKPKQGDQIRFWVFQHHEIISRQFPGIFDRFPKLNPSAFKPYTFFLEGIESKYYTGLQVSRDPGVPVVWAGCFLIVAGLFITFFTSHRRLWIKVLQQHGKSEISVAGMANKNPVGLEREIHELLGELKSSLGERKNA